MLVLASLFVLCIVPAAVLTTITMCRSCEKSGGQRLCFSLKKHLRISHKISTRAPTNKMTPHMQHPMHPAELSPERYSGEETDNQHTVLPIHCVVQVTGNNRTKLSLLGQRGVIVQAGDLGGWHTLVRGGASSNIRMQRYTRGDQCQTRFNLRSWRAESRFDCSEMH